jgi:hypothetical protein
MQLLIAIRLFCEVSDLKGPLNTEWETERHFAIYIYRGEDEWSTKET